MFTALRVLMVQKQENKSNGDAYYTLG